MWKLSEGESDWVFVSSMLHPRSGHGCALHGNYLYAFGGMSNEVRKNAERMDLSTGIWEEVSDLSRTFKSSGFSFSQAFSYRSSLYLIEKFGGRVEKMGDDNQWTKVAELGALHKYGIFPSPLVTPEVLGC